MPQAPRINDAEASAKYNTTQQAAAQQRAERLRVTGLDYAGNDKLIAAAVATRAGTYTDGSVDGYGRPIQQSKQLALIEQFNNELSGATKDAWAVSILRRAQNYKPLEQPDGQQLFNVSTALQQLLLGRAGSWRGASFGAGGNGGF